MAIVEKMNAFAHSENKKLLILLSFMADDVVDNCNGIPRFDQVFVDYLNNNNYLYVDTLQKHQEEFQAFRLSPTEYVNRYYTDHYNPQGNHFFAFSVKDAILEWLKIKPPTYDQSMDRALQIIRSKASCKDGSA